MNFSNFSTNPEWNATPSWDCTELIYQLAQTYCFCPSLQQVTPGVNEFCGWEDLKSFSYPNIAKFSLETNSLMQQEQANFHACDKASEGLKAEETKSSSSEQTSLPTNNGNPNSSEEAQETIKKRRRRSSKLEIRSKLIKVKSQILKRGISSFYSSPKQQRGSAPNNISRRSRYALPYYKNVYFPSKLGSFLL